MHVATSAGHHEFWMKERVTFKFMQCHNDYKQRLMSPFLTQSESKQEWTVSGNWHLVKMFKCVKDEKAIDMNNIEQRMAGFIQGPCAPLDGLQGLGRNNICVLQFRNIYVLRVEPNPTFISHQTVSASHKLTPLYHYVWERSVNIWWWGLYSTIEEKKKKKKSLHCFCGPFVLH